MVDTSNSSAGSHDDVITCDDSVPDLPPLQEPNFWWGNHDGNEFCELMNSLYDEIVHWRKNLFMITHGSARKAFVQELPRRLVGVQHWNLLL